jgi:hypothetical protein
MHADNNVWLAKKVLNHDLILSSIDFTQRFALFAHITTSFCGTEMMAAFVNKARNAFWTFTRISLENHARKHWYFLGELLSVSVSPDFG